MASLKNTPKSGSTETASRSSTVIWIPLNVSKVMLQRLKLLRNAESSWSTLTTLPKATNGNSITSTKSNGNWNSESEMVVQEADKTLDVINIRKFIHKAPLTGAFFDLFLPNSC